MIPKPPKQLKRRLVHLTRTFTHDILELQALMLKKLATVTFWFILTPPLIILLSATLNVHSNQIKALQTSQPLKLSDIPVENNINGQVLAVKIEDARPLMVAKFLKGTPLEPYSNLIVESSDKYNIDYRLIPAIAMKESGAGVGINQATHNAWGFENGRTKFDSWESAINAVAKTLKNQYVVKGLTTPDQIMAIYAPPAIANGGRWAQDVNYFFSQMEAL